MIYGVPTGVDDVIILVLKTHKFRGWLLSNRNKLYLDFFFFYPFIIFRNIRLTLI